MGVRETIEHHLVLEHMRATLRYAAFTCGNGRDYLAERIGVSTTTLRRLLDGGDLAYPTWRRMLAWCDDVGFEAVHLEQAALAILVSYVPAPARQRVRDSIARRVKHALVSAGQPLPAWLEAELEACTMVRRLQRSR